MLLEEDTLTDWTGDKIISDIRTLGHQHEKPASDLPLFHDVKGVDTSTREAISFWYDDDMRMYLMTIPATVATKRLRGAAMVSGGSGQIHALTRKHRTTCSATHNS